MFYCVGAVGLTHFNVYDMAIINLQWQNECFCMDSLLNLWVIPGCHRQTGLLEIFVQYTRHPLSNLLKIPVVFLLPSFPFVFALTPAAPASVLRSMSCLTAWHGCWTFPNKVDILCCQDFQFFFRIVIIIINKKTKQKWWILLLLLLVVVFIIIFMMSLHNNNNNRDV